MKSTGESSSIITRLPLEVLEVLIQFSSTQVQLALCRLSKFFHESTTRLLYRHISLSSPTTVIACCRTLISKSGAARAVRSLLISYTYYTTSSNSLLSAYYSLIKGALGAVTGLHTLKLLVHDPYFATLLNNRRFRFLHHFECYLKPSASLIHFLNQHRKITYLQVSPDEDTSEHVEPSSPLPIIELPGLQYFAGNVQSVPCLGPACSLRAAIISWNVMDLNPDLAFSALQRTSNATLALVSCRRRGWNLDLIDQVSKRLPSILSLHISNVLMVDASPTTAYLQSIKSYLSRFSQLQRLVINCIDYWEMGNITCNLDQDLTTVTEWGEACATLTEITLPHSDELSWYRISDNVWIPDPKSPKGVVWLSDAVASKRHQKWGPFAKSLPRTHEAKNPPHDFADTITNARLLFEDLLQSHAKRSKADQDARQTHNK